MKKVKIMLMAITVLAVAGGALAFKAQKFGAPPLCCYTTLTASITVQPPITNYPCTVEIPDYTTDLLDPDAVGPTLTAYCTTAPVNGCDAAPINCSTSVKILD